MPANGIGAQVDEAHRSLALKLTRRSLEPLCRWPIVFAAAIFNELIEIREAPLIKVPYDWVEGVGEILNTIMLPTVATLWARRLRSTAHEMEPVGKD